MELVAWTPIAPFEPTVTLPFIFVSPSVVESFSTYSPIAFSSRAISPLKFTPVFLA